MRVSGTIRYTEQDLALSQTAFSQAQPQPLWKAACAIACLGAVIGFGVSTVLSIVLEPLLPELSEHTAWGATIGAILLVSAGAWRLSAKLSPAQAVAMGRPQAFHLDDDGFSLSSDTAETHMGWAHFLTARIETDWVALRTRDETIVLLRPDFVADQAAWNEAKRTVGAKVAST